MKGKVRNTYSFYKINGRIAIDLLDLIAGLRSVGLEVFASEMRENYEKAEKELL